MGSVVFGLYILIPYINFDCSTLLDSVGVSYGLDFDGTNDHHIINSYHDITGSGDRTVELWIKTAPWATLGLAVELLLHIPGLTRYAEGQFVITVSIYGNVRSSVME